MLQNSNMKLRKENQQLLLKLENLETLLDDKNYDPEQDIIQKLESQEKAESLQ